MSDLEDDREISRLGAIIEKQEQRIAELEKALKCFTKAFNGAVVHAESSSDNRWERMPKEHFNELHVADCMARSVLMGKGGAKLKYVHDPKAVAEANEPTSWRSTVPIPHLEIPPSLQPKDKPQDGDLCVQDVYGTMWLVRWMVSHPGETLRTADPRIVGAVCAEAWHKDAIASADDDAERAYVCRAQEQAEAWRQYAAGK